MSKDHLDFSYLYWRISQYSKLVAYRCDGTKTSQLSCHLQCPSEYVYLNINRRQWAIEIQENQCPPPGKISDALLQEDRVSMPRELPGTG